MIGLWVLFVLHHHPIRMDVTNITCGSAEALSDARTLGLLIDCPVTRDNPEVCPFEDLRRLPMAERLKWFRGLSAADRHGLGDICAMCPDPVRRGRIEAGR